MEFGYSLKKHHDSAYPLLFLVFPSKNRKTSLEKHCLAGSSLPPRLLKAWANVKNKFTLSEAISFFSALSPAQTVLGECMR